MRLTRLSRSDSAVGDLLPTTPVVADSVSESVYASEIADKIKLTEAVTRYFCVSFGRNLWERGFERSYTRKARIL